MGFCLGHATDVRVDITGVSIPAQEGRAARCLTVDSNPKLLVEACSGANVLVGWIHTHPQWAALLSPVDQRQQLPLQRLLPQDVECIVYLAHAV